MDKTDAMKRLDAIEREAEELRKIIEKPEGFIFDDHKLYVAIIDEEPYLLTQNVDTEECEWHSFDGSHPIGTTWAGEHVSGQAALDYVETSGEIHEFSSAREGLEFFMKHYKG